MTDPERASEVVTNAELAAVLCRWITPLQDGSCCMCLEQPDEDHDEECRVPALQLIAERLRETNHDRS